MAEWTGHGQLYTGRSGLSVRPLRDRQRGGGDTNTSLLLLIEAELDHRTEVCSHGGLPDADLGVELLATGFFPGSLYLYVPHHMWRSWREWVQVTLEWCTRVRGTAPLCDEKSECSFTAGPPCQGFCIQAWMMQYCYRVYVSGPAQLKPVLVTGPLYSVKEGGFTFSLPEKERMKDQSTARGFGGRSRLMEIIGMEIIIIDTAQAPHLYDIKSSILALNLQTCPSLGFSFPFY